MGNFMKYFLQDFGSIGRSLWNVFSDFFAFLGNLLNFPKRMKAIEAYAGEFSTGDWILMLIANILLLAIIVIGMIFLVRLLRRLFRFRVPVKEHEALTKQVKDLQRDLLRSNYEKDKLLQMKMAELGMSQQDIEKQLAEGEEQEEFVPSGNRNTIQSPCVNPEDSRFFRLTWWITTIKRSISLRFMTTALRCRNSATGFAGMRRRSWDCTMTSA